ncbi:succinate dehydrogenase, hydrophobic membrane anchor protein [Pollutimonas nitritireducens]|uniref:Succinate dehydrogenase hydrophobic membrane anchor subunit n=1 Tax=Pollutimonas nitritireducens TaxID=2045209 RepID=A0A2N4UGH0_9BURK|nr:succinate dehydrogenase, hydrophobic membrane anchor protein [Pollutimonas nitritireducens]PLC54121.1 succinate dehydrogenase, hydrophobic membrane anchor protein [Pollutimonas nitritireducens]
MKKSPVSGLGAWIIQRFTAIYLLFFFLFLLVYFVFFPPVSYDAWQDSMSGAALMVTTSVFFIALLAHAWVGLRDVIMDYVKPLPLRMTVLALLALSLISMGAWVMQVLFTAGG